GPTPPAARRSGGTGRHRRRSPSGVLPGRRGGGGADGGPVDVDGPGGGDGERTVAVAAGRRRPEVDAPRTGRPDDRTAIGMSTAWRGPSGVVSFSPSRPKLNCFPLMDTAPGR